MDYKIQIIRSNRKTYSLEIREPNVLTVRAPYRMTEWAIRKALEEHRVWIEEHMQIVARRESEQPKQPRFAQEELEQMAQEALRVIPPKAAYYAGLLGVSYGRVTIRSQRTRWGSCSSKGNLNFNCLLTQVPEPVMDYVIVHELCHRIEMNHSARFWDLVASIVPDYKIQRKWLREKGTTLISRL